MQYLYLFCKKTLKSPFIQQKWHHFVCSLATVHLIFDMRLLFIKE